MSVSLSTFPKRRRDDKCAKATPDELYSRSSAVPAPLEWLAASSLYLCSPEHSSSWLGCLCRNLSIKPQESPEGDNIIVLPTTHPSIQQSSSCTRSTRSKHSATLKYILQSLTPSNQPSCRQRQGLMSRSPLSSPTRRDASSLARERARREMVRNHKQLLEPLVRRCFKAVPTQLATKLTKQCFLNYRKV